ncbi:hypothetical protein [Arthrobacter sp. NA-172]|uniref:hypothetical protein n=1 Tax=Arthrobacter sp. NA-172 TaxID=3367524 RepID=UPI0037544D81
MKADQDPLPTRLTPRQIVTAMSGLIIAMLLAQLDNMIVAPALPTIVGELGGMDHLAWVTTGSPEIIGLGVTAAVGLVLFLVIENKAAEPVIPLRLFSSSNFSLANALGFIVGFAMFGGITFLPQFQQYVQDQSATSSGLLLMPMMIAAMIVSLGGGLLVTRTGHYKSLPIAGSALMAVGLFLFSTMGWTPRPGSRAYTWRFSVRAWAA